MRGHFWCSIILKINIDCLVGFIYVGYILGHGSDAGIFVGCNLYDVAHTSGLQ